MLSNKLLSVIAAAIIALFMFGCSGGEKGEDPEPVKHYPPEKPSGLTAVASNPNEISFSWTKDTTADTANYYNIFYSTDSLGEYKILSVSYDYFFPRTEIYGNEIILSGFSASTRYYFKLLAVNYYGISDTSDIVSEKTLIDTPENLKTTLLPNNDLILEWDEVIDNEKQRSLRGIGGEGNSNSVKYKVYSSDDLLEEYSFVSETNETTMKFSNIDKTKKYSFKVSAVDKDDREGGKSDSVSVDSFTGDLPSVPQKLSAVLKVDDLDMGKISAELSWNIVSGANEYKVYYSTQPQIAYEYYAPTQNNSMIVGGLNSGTTYYFKVSAVNSVGEGEKSQEASVQTSAPTAPSTPTGLSAELIVDEDVTFVYWNPVSNADGYYLYVSDSPTRQFQKDERPRFENGVRFRDASTSWIRYYKVSAFNELGESPLSEYVPIINPN